MLKKYENAKNVISNALHKGSAIGFEYGPCVEAGMVANQRVIENMFQDIILNGTPVEEAAQTAEDKINELIGDL